ncbi:MAG TPA: tautomerase family protein [Candidatus Sulfotelmatobacter sp.]|nr:tautomerase family protein [Candidatus Sulfotelmatobacter sp.]
MPLVRVELQQEKPAEYRRAISDAIQRSLVEVFSVPARDQFQVFSQHSGGTLVYNPDYLGIHRDENFLMVQVFLSTGRTVELKQAFYAKLAGLLKEKPGIRPENVMINLVEVRGEDWSFGNGVAQYVVLPRDQWK